MPEVAVVAYARTPLHRDVGACNEVELIMPVLQEVKQQAGLQLADIDFVCSGSCDYLQGAAFAFVMGVDALGAVPPIKESHVEMDAAWALYEAWLKIQMGQAEVALVYGFGKSSSGDLPSVLSLQLDPYYLAPLWPDSISLAALQARLMLEQGLISEEDMARVVVQSRAHALERPGAQLKGRHSVAELLAQPMYRAPLRKHDCPPITDGAAALIIAEEKKARRLCKQPAFIRAIDHRIESSHLGVRDLTRSVSTEIAARQLGLAEKQPEIAELHAPFSHQELILQKALGLNPDVVLNPSGGPLSGNIMMAGGLERIGAAAEEIIQGRVRRALAHATSGPCLQQNLLTLLEAA